MKKGEARRGSERERDRRGREERRYGQWKEGGGQSSLVLQRVDEWVGLVTMWPHAYVVFESVYVCLDMHVWLCWNLSVFAGPCKMYLQEYAS